MKLVGQEFVIIDDFGWPRNPDGYNKLVKRVAQKAGISDIHPHMFRHTFVSLLMSNPDIGVATVAAEAGHAQPSTTLMIYTQQYKKLRESLRNQLRSELYGKERIAAMPFCTKRHSCVLFWWAVRDSNPHSSGYEPPALTVKLTALTDV